MSGFPEATLAAWREAAEIDIETSRGGDAPIHRTTIWIVVVDGEVFVRSVRGPAGRWYRELSAHPTGAVHLDSQRVSVKASAVADQSSIQRVSDELDRKYRSRWPGPTASMLQPDTLPTTLRLEPA